MTKDALRSEWQPRASRHSELHHQRMSTTVL